MCIGVGGMGKDCICMGVHGRWGVWGREYMHGGEGHGEGVHVQGGGGHGAGEHVHEGGAVVQAPNKVLHIMLHLTMVPHLQLAAKDHH